MLVSYGKPDQKTGVQIFSACDEANYQVGATFPYGGHIYLIISIPVRGIDMSDGISKTFLSFDAKLLIHNDGVL
jgi:hypothetical protein